MTYGRPTVIDDEHVHTCLRQQRAGSARTSFATGAQTKSTELDSSDPRITSHCLSILYAADSSCSFQPLPILKASTGYHQNAPAYIGCLSYATTTTLSWYSAKLASRKVPGPWRQAQHSCQAHPWWVRQPGITDASLQSRYLG